MTGSVPAPPAPRAPAMDCWGCRREHRPDETTGTAFCAECQKRKDDELARRRAWRELDPPPIAA